MTQKSIDPSTGKVIREYPGTSSAGVERSLAGAQQAFRSWRRLSFPERAAPLLRAAEILTAQAGELAALMTREMGKPIRQAASEVEKCAWVCRHYAEHAAAMLAPESVASDASRSYVRFDPLGAVLAVMPWNFPFWQVIRFAAPALMAGNVCLLKHAANVPGCAKKIGEIFAAAGFPEGCFSTLLVDAATARGLVADPRVQAVTLTGSAEAGRSLAAAAGKSLKKVVLELGGSDPFIVLPDCDLERTVETAVQAKMFNSGQSCIAAKRFILVGKVGDDFADRLCERFARLRVGDPLDPATEVGPLARSEFVDDLDAQVRGSVSAGARLLCGGHKLERPGFFYAPTILDRVRPGMPAYQDELFGPVAALIRAADENEALAIANDNVYGLGASVWTADLARAEKMAAEIEAGMVFVNGMVKSDPRLPFGGVKCSGYGRELSHYGIREFVDIKTVWIA